MIMRVARGTTENGARLDKMVRHDNTLWLRQLNSRFLIESGRGLGPKTPQQPPGGPGKGSKGAVLTPPQVSSVDSNIARDPFRER